MFKSKEKSILEKAYIMPNIDNNTIRGILKHPKFFRGHVRTSIGKIYKTDEFKKRSDKILGMKMP